MSTELKPPGPKERLRLRGLAPKKSLGQNFLTDRHLCERIARAVKDRADAAVEIGPGLGAITLPMLAHGIRVHAIERDDGLIPLLTEEAAAEVESGQLTIERADALTVDWREKLKSFGIPAVIVGNLPYLITGRLLEMATQCSADVRGAIFMVQREVADRLLSSPGGEAYGGLTIFVRAAFAVERLAIARGGAFYPPPNVDSAVVVLTPHATRRAIEDDAFRQLVHRAFQARRKTLRNAWRGVFDWSMPELEAHAASVGISLDARGETLDVEPYEALARVRRGEASPTEV